MAEKVWVTKYALTKGIVACDLVSRDMDSSMITVRWIGGLNGVAYFHGNEWRWTKKEAENLANEMRLGKIAALERQIKKLKAMKF